MTRLPRSHEDRRPLSDARCLLLGARAARLYSDVMPTLLPFAVDRADITPYYEALADALNGRGPALAPYEDRKSVV